MGPTTRLVSHDGDDDDDDGGRGGGVTTTVTTAGDECLVHRVSVACRAGLVHAMKAITSERGKRKISLQVLPSLLLSTATPGKSRPRRWTRAQTHGDDDHHHHHHHDHHHHHHHGNAHSRRKVKPDKSSSDKSRTSNPNPNPNPNSSSDKSRTSPPTWWRWSSSSSSSLLSSSSSSLLLSEAGRVAKRLVHSWVSQYERGGDAFEKEKSKSLWCFGGGRGGGWKPKRDLGRGSREGESPVGTLDETRRDETPVRRA